MTKSRRDDPLLTVGNHRTRTEDAPPKSCRDDTYNFITRPTNSAVLSGLEVGSGRAYGGRWLKPTVNTCIERSRSKVPSLRDFSLNTSVFLFIFCWLCFTNTTQAQGTPVFSKKETLYSTKNGNAIGSLLLSIEPKNTTATNNEWVLTIGDRGANFFDSRTERTLWIFSRRVTFNDFRRDMRNRDYAVEAKGITEFMPFCENGIRFELKDWEELRRQTQVSFFINASAGQQVTLRLVFYASTQDRRRTTIDEEAKVRIDFVVPDLSTLAARRPNAPATASASAQEGELISLTERIDPAAAQALREAKLAEEELAQAEGATREQRMALLNSFITERNREILELQEEVNALLADKNTKVDEFKIDSLELIADELKKKMDFWENGYTDILLTEEAMHDRYTRLRLSHTATTKKIIELRKQQRPFNDIINFVQNNLLLSLGGGVVGVFLVRIITKLGKKMINKIKSKIKSKINKMKSDAKKSVKQQPKKWFGKSRKKEKIIDEEFENIDINDLAEI
jgi:hypothetical protein